ncbi:MAG: hypothetical protein RI911_835, partial [Candidatus Parcubacteria bacterium]
MFDGSLVLEREYIMTEHWIVRTAARIDEM